MIRPAGYFNRLSFYTHIEKMKMRILIEGGDRAWLVVPVLEQLQKDINNWSYARPAKRSHAYRISMDRPERALL